jgi:selenocysteine lyase/cysteine desulfurase
VAEALGDLTGLIEKEARDRGMEAVPSGRRASHMIGIKLPPDAPEDLAVRLAKENVFVSVRGRSLRISPHLYNTEADVEKLFDSLARHVR